MMEGDLTSRCRAVREKINPKPSYALVYELCKEHPEVYDTKRLVRIFHQKHPDHQQQAQSETDPICRLQKEVSRHLQKCPSLDAVRASLIKNPELARSPKDLAVTIARDFSKYPLRGQQTYRKKKKKKGWKSRTGEKTKKEFQPYAAVYGHPGNYWVLAWKGWSRSFVVNPRYLYSGMPRKYKTKEEALSDCQRGNCKLVSYQEFKKIAKPVPNEILWALERKNQRPKGASIWQYKNLVGHVAGMLPGQYKGDPKMAQVYLRDIEHIFPQAKDLYNVVILKAIRLSRGREMTARRTVEHLRKIKYGYKGQPEYMRVVYVPM